MLVAHDSRRGFKSTVDKRALARGLHKLTSHLHHVEIMSRLRSLDYFLDLFPTASRRGLLIYRRCGD